MNPGWVALALAKGAYDARRHDPRGRRGDRHPARARPRDRRRDDDGRGRVRDASCSAAGCGRATSRRPPACRCRCTRPSTCTCTPTPIDRRRPRPAGPARPRRLLLRPPLPRPAAGRRVRARRAPAVDREPRRGLRVRRVRARLGPLRARARARPSSACPCCGSLQYERFLNAPESFTPDGHFCLGETAEVAGLFTACGINSQGIIFGAGAGRALAEWIVEGAPTIDSAERRLHRFARAQNNRRYLHARTHEGLGKRLTPCTGRTCSPRRRAASAAARCTSGCSRPARASARPRAGSARTGTRRRRRRRSTSTATAARTGSRTCAAEHRAARERRGAVRPLLVRQGRGRGPGRARGAAARLHAEPRRRGRPRRLHADAQPARRHRARRHRHPAGRGPVPRDHARRSRSTRRWLLAAAPGAADAPRRRPRRHRRLRDARRPGAVEPRAARAHLARPDCGFPWGRAREIEIGSAYALALRVSFVGELGYELYPPADLRGQRSTTR